VTLSDLSIRNPVFAWMLMAALVVFGALGFRRLGVSELPEVDFPVVSINVTIEGASPEVMETDVADLLEDAVSSIAGVREISSSSKHGECSVTVEFDLERDIDAAFQDVQAKVSQAQRRLPADIEPPVISKVSPLERPILWLALSGPRSTQELSEFARDRLKDRFQTIPGVGDIMLGGYLERNIRIWLDAARLEAYGLAVSDVADALRREHIEVPAGRLETPLRELQVRSKGEATSLEEIRRIVVARRGGHLVRLNDPATVENGTEDVRRISRRNGAPAVGLGIRKQSGANAVAVARAVKERLEEIRPDLPADLSIDVSYDGTVFVEESIREVLFTIVLAVVLTSLVCWLFLGSFSSTLNVLLSIPTSVVGTFALMHFAGFTLNTFTLLGLSLSVGIVVDDAIMVMENIFRHAQQGKPRVRAAAEGAREITFAALAATLAIVAIFLPVAFMRGMIGRMFFEFGVTISAAVMLSLLEAITLTPSRCAQFLYAGERRTSIGKALEAGFSGLADGYRRMLVPRLRHSLGVLLAAAALFGGSLLLAGRIGKEFLPPQDQGRFLVRLQTPLGSSIEETDRTARRCEAHLLSMPEIRQYYLAVGGFGGGDANAAMFFVTMKPRGERSRTQGEVTADLRARLNAIPGARAMIQDLSQSDPTRQGRSFPVEFSIHGKEWGELARLSERVSAAMEESGMMADVDSDYRMGQPEVKILPLRKRAADLGVSMEAIGSTVQALVGGVKVGRFKEGGRRHDIRMRLMQPQRLRPEDIGRLQVRSGSGGLVRLSELVEIEEAPSLQSILRKNRERAITLTASIAPGFTQAQCVAEVERIGRELLPEGYRVVLSGSAQTYRESMRALLFALWLGIAVAYMILASQFNSFLHPLTILLALPFSLTGALGLLWATGQTINLYSMIGLVLLMGIVKKNSILLVDYTNQLRKDGLPAEEALRQACPVRLRPILMTSCSTIAGAVPAALALGPGAEVRVPMAIAVIGGILLSTLLTLFVVPCAYRLLDDAKERLLHRR
jgi:hydrophobe/amphiphile efflux-1 (HAE1) family protein